MFSKAARTFKHAFVALVAISFIVFAASNHKTVSISLFPLPYEIELPLFLLAVACVFFGVFMSLFVIGGKMAKLRHQGISDKKRALTLEAELKSLKAKSASIVILPDMPANDHAR